MKNTTEAAESNKAPKAASAAEEHTFQAEMQQLLHIIVHSLYSEREIFLRELISNASDAINKVRFEMLTDANVRDPDAELGIDLTVAAEGKTLTVNDTGIGMTHDELIASLGTIARSGTLDFVKQLSASDSGKRTEMIGQFGVGFYSVFMVAKQVVVDSCPANPSEPAWCWISDGSGGYTMQPSDRTQRGTSIRIHLREEAEEFAQTYRVENVVKHYSTFVAHPIRLDGKQLNTQEAIWSLPKGEVSTEQHREFYKFLTHGLDDPLHTIHLSIDAPVQYRALMYLPPELTNERLYSHSGWGLKLYANRVFIQDDCQELLPMYLRFLRGMVDSEDLPLNVSREMVQQNPLLAKIRISLTGRVLRELKTLSEENASQYGAFWKEYGKVLKEGLTIDAPNQKRLLELARFKSSVGTDEEDLTSLKDYVSRMGEAQKEIFYFVGSSRKAIERHPSLEFFRRRGLEVLYFTDPIDNFVMVQLPEYEGKIFASIDQADLEMLKGAADPEDADHPELAQEALEQLITYVKETLGERVADVVVSKRLVESPAVLVRADNIPENMARIVKMMQQSDQVGPKILELNPRHTLVHHLSTLLAASAEEKPLLEEITEQLFDNCRLVEGTIDQPEAMVTRIQSMMEKVAAVRISKLQAGSAASSAEVTEAADPGDTAASDEHTGPASTANGDETSARGS